ncbi:MAG: GC-type dockerin domain-anchored protein [Phycisphaerales bacterium]|nr:GC-type dockerin domain-anchored protein [Phycisphaerales bacterium]
MIYDSYPIGRVGFDAPAVDLTTFLDGTTPIRLRYNGPVTLPSGGGGLIIEENTQTGWVDATAKFTVELGGSQPTREIVLKPAHCTGFQGVTNRFRVRYGASTVPRPLCDKLLTTSAVTVFEREEYGTASQTGSATPIQFTFRFVGCNDADVGQQGGIPGPDCTLNNNDFIVFIDMFFNHDPAADIGQQGGLNGADGNWDNNDFVVFIDIFFSGGCEGCSGPLPSCFGEGSGGGGYVPPKEDEGEGENLMFGAPADPAAALRAAIQQLIDTTPAGARRDQLIDFLNSLPPPPSGNDDH